MIISHKYKFIFVKTFKTASSSFEAAFSWIAGRDDIITSDEPMTRDYKDGVCRLGANSIFFNHKHAVEIRKCILPHVWSGYYKFCIERNPWDKALSWYYWDKPKDISLSEYILNDTMGCPHGQAIHLPDWPMYTDNDQVIVDKILRFEDLPAELSRLEQRLDMPQLDMPRVKGDTRPKGIHYRDVLGLAEKDKIATGFHKIIELMGYEY